MANINIDGATVEKSSLVRQLEEQGYKVELAKRHDLSEYGLTTVRDIGVFTERHNEEMFYMAIGDPDAGLEEALVLTDRHDMAALIEKLQQFQSEMGW